MSNNNENDGLSQESREQINGTTIWVQIAAYTSFISAGLSVLGMVRGGQFSGIVGIAISVYLGVQLLEQSKFMAQFNGNSNIRDYEESMKAESNYWMTLKILMFIAIGLIVIGLLLLLVFQDEILGGFAKAFSGAMR